MTSEIVRSGPGRHANWVVLIHGLGGNAHSWDQITPQLQTGFNVLSYDLRGHGSSNTPEGPWELTDFVADLKKILQKHDIEKTHLVGFSLGGLISQQFTLSHPERISQLVILSAVANRSDTEREKVRSRLKNLENDNLDANIDLAVDRWFSPEFRRDHPDKVQQRIETLRATDPQGYLHAYRIFSTVDLGDKLNQIKHQTLVMTGEFDPGSNVRMAEFMHQQISDSTLEILPGLRHSILVEAPDLVAQKLNRFLT